MIKTFLTLSLICFGLKLAVTFTKELIRRLMNWLYVSVCSFIRHRKIKNIEEAKKVQSGANGEKKAFVWCKKISRKYRYSSVIKNIMVNDSEIDSVLFVENAVYVVEVKNFSGEYVGTEGDKWMFSKIGLERRYLYSPLEQNKVHCEQLKRLLRDEYNITDVEIKNVVCLTNERIRFRDKSILEDERICLTYNELLKKVKLDRKRINSDNSYNWKKVVKRMSKENSYQQDEMEAHINRIQSKYGSY